MRHIRSVVQVPGRLVIVEHFEYKLFRVSLLVVLGVHNALVGFFSRLFCSYLWNKTSNKWLCFLISSSSVIFFSHWICHSSPRIPWFHCRTERRCIRLVSNSWPWCSSTRRNHILNEAYKKPISKKQQLKIYSQIKHTWLGGVSLAWYGVFQDYWKNHFKLLLV